VADATSNIDRAVRDDSFLSLDVADGVDLFNNIFTGVRGPDHATSQGEADKYAPSVNGIIFSGLSFSKVTGDSAASPRPASRQQIQSLKLVDVAVTGAADKEDVLKAVYLADNQTMTLTRPAKGELVGYTMEYKGDAKFDVLLLGLAERLAANSQAELLYLGQLNFGTVIDGNIRIAFPAPFHGKILEVFGMVAQVMVGADGAININLEIDTVNVTGGVVAMTTAAGGTLGTKLAGTAVTANNIFREGSAIDVEGSGAAGTRTSGILELYARVQRLPGA
jgi:hypothetical protein